VNNSSVPIVPEADTGLLLISAFALTGVMAWSPWRWRRYQRAQGGELRDAV
jgi:hypothetical protein